MDDELETQELLSPEKSGGGGKSKGFEAGVCVHCGL